MKIIFCYQNSRGGGTIAMQNIVSQLRSNYGGSFRIYTLNAIRNWGLIYLLIYLLKNISRYVNVIKAQKNISWIYTSTYIAGVAAIILKPIYKYKVCYHYHVSEIPTNPYFFPSKMFFTQKLKILIVRKLHLFFMSSVDLIIVPSKYSRKEILTSYKIVNKDKTKVVYNGISNKYFSKISPKSLDRLKNKIGISSNDVVISYFGRLEQHKNVKLLIEPLKLLQKSIKIKLQIIYSKPNNNEEDIYKEEIVELSKRFGVLDKIIFLQNPKNIISHYKISDLIILPSESEQLPLVMLEAFASKKLFAATAVGGITEVISKIDDRLLIRNLKTNNLTHKILSLISLPGLDKNEILEREYKFVKNLSWKNVGENIYNILNCEY